MTTHHLYDKALADVHAHLVASVQMQHQKALVVRLLHALDARADKVLAQEHTEHRRFRGIFKPALREMHAGAADAAVNEELSVAAGHTQRKKQQIAFRLLHLVDFRTGDVFRKFSGKAGQKHTVKRHLKAPP
jgi:hypothetical protein